MRPALLSLLASGLILALNFGTGIMVARLLDPEHRGLLAAAVSVCTLVAGVTSWSIADALARHTAAQAQPRFNLSGPHAVLVSAGTLAGAAALLLLLLSGTVLLPGTAPLIFGGLILIIPCMHVSQTAMGVLQGAHAWAGWNLARISPHFTCLLLLVPLTLSGAGLQPVAFAYGVSSLAPVLVSVAFAARGGITRQGTSFADVRRTAAETLRLHGGRIFQMVRQHLDKILIPLVFGPAVLGHYVAAMTLAAPLYAAAATLTSVYIPRIAREAAAAPCPMRLRTLHEVLGLIAAGTACALLYAWLSPPLVALLFGADYAPGAQYLPLTILIITGYCITKLMEAYMIALGRTRFVLLAETLPVASILLGAVLAASDFFTFLLFLCAASWAGAAVYAACFARLVQAFVLQPENLPR